MLKRIPALAIATSIAASMALATGSFAQTSEKPAEPSLTEPSTVAPSPSTTTTPAPSVSTTTAAAGPMMSDDEAKDWVNKTVYSSDGKNLGEVAEVLRDNSGHVTEMHADIGGFLGLGETRVKIMPSQFKLASDRVILNIAGDEAKTLPTLAK